MRTWLSRCPSARPAAVRGAAARRGRSWRAGRPPPGAPPGADARKAPARPRSCRAGPARSAKTSLRGSRRFFRRGPFHRGQGSPDHLENDRGRLLLACGGLNDDAAIRLGLRDRQIGLAALPLDFELLLLVAVGRLAARPARSRPSHALLGVDVEND